MDTKSILKLFWSLKSIVLKNINKLLDCIVIFILSLICSFCFSCQNNSDATQNEETLEELNFDQKNVQANVEHSIDLGEVVVPYIYNLKNRGTRINSSLIDDFEKAKALYVAYKELGDLKTLVAAEELITGVVLEIDDFLAEKIELITDLTVLDVLIEYYSEKVDNLSGEQKSKLEGKLASLLTRKANLQDLKNEEVSSPVMRCQGVFSFNEDTPDMPTFDLLRSHYSKIDSEGYSKELGVLSIIEYITRLQKHSKSDAYVDQKELDLVRKYAREFICSKDCEIIDCVKKVVKRMNGYIEDGDRYINIDKEGM